MRSLLMPTDDASAVFRTCISRVRNRLLKRRLEAIEPQVATAAREFARLAPLTRLHEIAAHPNGVRCVTAKQLSDVYTLRMAKKGAVGRSIYERLLTAPAHGRCPLCGQRVVSTLDHYLPKAHYPVLSVAPVNLIPACQDCNKLKLERVPQNASEATLHPYYDDLGNEPWLFATLVETSPPSLIFHVQPPAAWSAVKRTRLRHHFRDFRLAALYASHAAQELTDIRHSMVGVFEIGGADAVRASLQDSYESRRTAFTNSWQTAAYRTLAASQWYCDGGFR